jgi:hypothetical protein
MRMSALIDDLLTLAKVTRQGLKLQNVALNALGRGSSTRI